MAMTLIRTGCKRLYNSPGCSIESANDLEYSFQMANMDAMVHIGRDPKLGICATSGTQYVVPGMKTPFQQLAFGRTDASRLKDIGLLTEIVCCKMIEVPEELGVAFHANDPAATQQLLDVTQSKVGSFRPGLDLIAGVVGLRFHRQFVQELLTESPVVFREDNTPTQRYHGPIVEVLEDITLNKAGIDSLGGTLRLIGTARPETQEFGASVLVWLLRAWSETDPFSKFMSLFIPIEVILSQVRFDSTEMADQRAIDNEIRSVLLDHGGTRSGEMIAEYDKLRQLVHPPLTARFEYLAREAKIIGWESDVVAFKRFNRIRNGILHRGDRDIATQVPVGGEIKEESRQLEDLAERYVSWSLFRDGEPYRSRYRPPR